MQRKGFMNIKKVKNLITMHRAGSQPKEIAKALKVSEGTVTRYITTIRKNKKADKVKLLPRRKTETTVVGTVGIAVEEWINENMDIYHEDYEGDAHCG